MNWLYALIFLMMSAWGGCDLSAVLREGKVIVSVTNVSREQQPTMFWVAVSLRILLVIGSLLGAVLSAFQIRLYNGV